MYSDLTGERGVLMGALAGIIEAQYQVLRQRGHSPSEAFNETVEELTQSLVPLVGENGMDWMFANCSVTAQRGALDWKGKFKEATLPLLNELYDSVASGAEAARTIQRGSTPGYRQELEVELRELRETELWQTGAVVRKLRSK
ncbi:ketol-acid reductoisomerase [Cesiribacter andamanensis AMV16]|uniref:Acetohydroxy-acid isomeroreductase n=1 Tax=Cesiribacter andamanensis AMV16 TaxID=1279009 RepID=M7NJR5_9BACT|nr:ketol-acid reductoisomerase [Cesiribacter andamanensis AMV16]